jgi:outer membrane protein OmpA-like peptidoglycan-associated protein
MAPLTIIKHRKGQIAMRTIVLICALTLALSGCATGQSTDETKKGAAAGALLGGLLGGIMGFQKDHSGGALKGALIGAAAGGALGAGTGAYMDRQQDEFESQLASERDAHAVEVERLENENLKITMSNEVSFDFDSASVKPTFAPTLDKVADIVSRYERTNMVVIGHTDSTGSASYNQTLSENRASSVATYIEGQGVSPTRVQTEGMGETDPRASNDNEAGRQLNRRVEIFIVPEEGIE